MQQEIKNENTSNRWQSFNDIYSDIINQKMSYLKRLSQTKSGFRSKFEDSAKTLRMTQDRPFLEQT